MLTPGLTPGQIATLTTELNTDPAALRRSRLGSCRTFLGTLDHRGRRLVP
jgi:hypothetical protein